MRIVTILFLAISINCFSQTKDTVFVRKHSAKLATYLSIAIPGAGKVYNHKYWKVPVLYAGFAGLLYAGYFNQQQIWDYTTMWEKNKTTHIYSSQGLIQIIGEYKNDRDLMYIFAGLLYVANVIDAAVDAHFYDYDVSNDLSLNWQPMLFKDNSTPLCAGISFKLKFK